MVDTRLEICISVSYFAFLKTLRASHYTSLFDRSKLQQGLWENTFNGLDIHVFSSGAGSGIYNPKQPVEMFVLVCEFSDFFPISDNTEPKNYPDVVLTGESY